jgi:hypothetical protein
MKPNIYKVLTRAVEDGASYAWRSRIFKYTDTPRDDDAIDNIVNCVMLEISEIFEFEENNETSTTL